MKRIGCVNGWGVSDAEVRRAFAASGWPEPICVIAPTKNWKEQLCRNELDTVVGYSTGAFLLLLEGGLPSAWRDVILLAPFRSLVSEQGLGGKVRRAQLQFALRWLKRDPLAAVNDFRARAGLGDALDWLPGSEEELAWGIELLATQVADGEAEECFRMYIGAEDPLLDADAVSRGLPRITVLPGVGHGLCGLLAGALEARAR